MRIIKGVDPIAVAHPVILIFGQPGIGKTSLAYSAASPLLLDFDGGAHRAVNRGDTLAISTWTDVAELMETPTALEPYRSIVVDTVGRCLDLLTASIIEKTPKLGPGGNLTQQGWGQLKTGFRVWMTQLRALGKDVLLIAHDKEDKDGDLRVVRPDIVGGSYSEVMKVSDCVGYLYMAGRDRVLDFSPTERWVGKNPGQWAPLKVPPVAKATRVVGDVFDQARAALGKISEASAKVAKSVDQYRDDIASLNSVEEFNRAIPDVQQLNATIKPQVAKLLIDTAVAKGFEFDKALKAFRVPVAADL